MKAQYIFLNNLYKSDKDLAIQEFKKYPLDIHLSLQYLSIDFLTDLGIWNDTLSKQLISYNTKTFFINYKYTDMKFRLLNLLNHNEDINNIDSSILLDYTMSINVNYFNINLLPFINERNYRRDFTIDYLRLVKNQNSAVFYKLIRSDKDLYSFLLTKDKSLIDDKKFIVSLLGSELTDLALLSLKYEEWSKYRQYISDDFIKTYFFMFKLSDLFILKDVTFLWEIIKSEHYTVRYKMYSDLQSNEKIIQLVRQDLKNLVKSNYKSIGEKYRSCYLDTLSIIKEMVDQIVVYPALIDLVYLVIKEMEEISKDICMFYILKYITDQSYFVREDSFCRWYINIVKFLKLLYKDVDSRSLQDLIDLYLSNKKYSCILLFEITKTSSLLFDLNEIFLYEDYHIKLKDEIYERYQIVIGADKPKCDIQYLTGYEIGKLEYVCFDFKYKEEYLYIRNIAKLITKNINKITEFNRIEDFFRKCINSQKEDIRLIGNSMISKIEMHIKNRID